MSSSDLRSYRAASPVRSSLPVVSDASRSVRASRPERGSTRKGNARDDASSVRFSPIDRDFRTSRGGFEATRRSDEVPASFRDAPARRLVGAAYAPNRDATERAAFRALAVEDAPRRRGLSSTSTGSTGDARLAAKAKAPARKRTPPPPGRRSLSAIRRG